MEILGTSRISKSMKILKGLVLILLLAFTCTSANAVTLPFEDGFENIAVGDYPDENGWQMLFSGKDAYVSDAVAHTGTKSFRLDSNPNWARMDYVYLEEVPDQLTCEVSIYVDPTEGKGALAGFMEGVGNEGPTWNKFSVSAIPGQVYFDSVYMGEYTPGTWCTLRADLDFVNLTADLWLDGSLVVEDAVIYPKEFDDPTYGHIVLNKWGVVSSNYTIGSTNVVYFDDVSIRATTTGLSGWVFMPPDAPDFGYSVNEADFVYFYSFNFVQSYNTSTGGWSIHMPTDWIYFDWPFYYELESGHLWFAWPPESGLWVYHFSTGEWEVLPRIIP